MTSSPFRVSATMIDSSTACWVAARYCHATSSIAPPRLGLHHHFEQAGTPYTRTSSLRMPQPSVVIQARNPAGNRVPRDLPPP
jgi:hypothetical protein